MDMLQQRPHGSSPTESRKKIDFLDSILGDIRSFRQQVLLSLSDVFGFERATFFLIDKAGNMYSPTLLEIDEKYANEFVDHFHTTDIFHPVKVFDKAISKKVLSIDDVMGYHKFVNTEYYNTFLREQNIYHEVAVFLSNNNRLTGVISLFREKSEQQFSATEIGNLRDISHYISKALTNYRTLLESDYNNELLKTFSNNSPLGLIAFNRSLSVCFANTYIEDLCSSVAIADPGFDAQTLLKKYIVEGQVPSGPGFVKLISLPSNKMLKVQVLPAVHYNMGEDSLFMALVFDDKLVIGQNKLANPLFSTLTKREKEILELLLHGASNQDIASSLFISTHTVKAHLQNIFKKMDVPNRTSLCYKINLLNN